MESDTLATVNVDEGFLPKYDRKFLDYYGIESSFVRTLSDYFTTALARMLDEKGMLESWDTVALFSSKSALKKLSDYFKQIDEAKKAILQESFGSIPVGSTENICDQYLGKGSFRQMLQSLEVDSE